MNLIVDIGNTLVKIAVFQKNEIQVLKHAKTIDSPELEIILKSFPDISSGIVSNVRHIPDEAIKLALPGVSLIHFDHQTPLPINNCYQSPETLGKDRLAGTVGAISLFPDSNILVIDAGTCITYDLITNEGDYLGGAISPGIMMRFKALHEYTGNLPMVMPELNETPCLIGKTTNESILSGVQTAVIAEVEGMISRMNAQYEQLKIVVTGGDHKYFDKYLKNNIFAAPNLVLKGLKKILDFNEDK